MSDYSNNATLIYRYDINDELAIFRVAPDFGEVAEFIPGQYAELAFPEIQDSSKHKLIRRAYSIASSPNIREYLEFYIVIVPGGELTPKLWQLKIGDRLWMGSKIKGKFTLENVARDKNVVCVATGTGLAPFLSMLRTYHQSPPWKRFIIVHGARYAHDLGYREELSDWMRRDNRVIYIPSVTREPEATNWTGHRGRVPTIFEPQTYNDLTGTPLNPESCQILLCGNPDMIDSMQELLENKGFILHKKKEPGNIHVERYW